MANEPHKLISLPNRSYQASARSSIKKIAQAAGFKPKRIAELEIVVAELTSNIIKHTGKGGELLVKQMTGKHPGIEIICIDEGPGMESVTKMMEDGVSSTNTLGQGLGAIKRLSDECDVYSLKGWGTVFLVRMFVEKKDPLRKRFVETGVLMLPKDGETACGDNYLCVEKGNSLRFAACDGLGHGPDASEAAKQCLTALAADITSQPVEQIRHVHAQVRKTRGAVMYVSHFDFLNKQMVYCGVGNIAVKIVGASGSTRNCISYNGIVGHSIPNTLNNHIVPWAKSDLIIIHSDGLSTRWELNKYPGITKHDNSIIAAALYKDFCRKTDDVMVAVISQYKATKK